jgi:hypothetical protein
MFRPPSGHLQVFMLYILKEPAACYFLSFRCCTLYCFLQHMHRLVNVFVFNFVNICACVFVFLPAGLYVVKLTCAYFGMIFKTLTRRCICCRKQYKVQHRKDRK